jgi:hypothetical protein
VGQLTTLTGPQGWTKTYLPSLDPVCSVPTPGPDIPAKSASDVLSPTLLREVEVVEPGCTCSLP